MAVAVGAGSCARTRRALSLVLDGEAEASDIKLLEEHLCACSACRSFAVGVSAFTRTLRAVGGYEGKGAEDER